MRAVDRGVLNVDICFLEKVVQVSCHGQRLRHSKVEMYKGTDSSQLRRQQRKSRKSQLIFPNTLLLTMRFTSALILAVATFVRFASAAPQGPECPVTPDCALICKGLCPSPGVVCHCPIQ